LASQRWEARTWSKKRIEKQGPRDKSNWGKKKGKTRNPGRDHGEGKNRKKTRIDSCVQKPFTTGNDPSSDQGKGQVAKRVSMAKADWVPGITKKGVRKN